MRKQTRKLYNYAIKNGIPILLGIVQHNQLYAWCPLCRTFHNHSNGEGIRIAHCHDKAGIIPLYNGFREYIILDIENLKDNNENLEISSYLYDKFLDHIEGNEQKLIKRYKLNVKLNKV